MPSTQQWNLTVQRALGKQWVLEVGYVGTHGVHLRETRDALQSQNATPDNPVVVGGESITANTFDNAIARSRAQGINGYNGFQLFANDAYSHYNSLQTTLSRRWGAGYFQAAYTFSRSTDATSSGNTAFNTAFNDESTLAASRGLSDFDRTHRLAVSYRYDLPFFSHCGRLDAQAAGGMGHQRHHHRSIRAAVLGARFRRGHRVPRVGLRTGCDAASLASGNVDVERL